MKGKIRKKVADAGFILDLIPTNRTERAFLKMAYDEGALRVLGKTQGSDELSVALPSTSYSAVVFLRKETLQDIKRLLGVETG